MRGVRMNKKSILISQKESNYDNWIAVLPILSNLCVSWMQPQLKGTCILTV
jgi:hypothetical protein